MKAVKVIQSNPETRRANSVRFLMWVMFFCAFCVVVLENANNYGN
jgi:hypothetical protein